MAIIGYTQILYNVLYGLNTKYFDAGRPRVNVVVISVRYWTIRLGTLQITICTRYNLQLFTPHSYSDMNVRSQTCTEGCLRIRLMEPQEEST